MLSLFIWKSRGQQTEHGEKLHMTQALLLLLGLKLLLLRLEGSLDLKLRHNVKEQPHTLGVGHQGQQVVMLHLVDPQPLLVSQEWFLELLGLPKDTSSSMLPVPQTSQTGGAMMSFPKEVGVPVATPMAMKAAQV